MAGMRGFVGSRMAAVALAVGLAVALAACGGNGAFKPDLEGTGRYGAVVPSEDWPAGAPADVPAFPGHLDNLMGGGSSRVRMFFSGVSGDQFNAYLADLREAGYTLKGVAYYTEAQGEEHAEEEAARGEYDAVVATREPKKVTMTVPATPDGSVTFDIDGLTQAERDAMPDMNGWRQRE